ncbi:MAG: imidazole glycerol phosphate synthase subunit HisH [Rikenellaceae bacterium]
MLVIVDYDTGNLCSVENAIGRIGEPYIVSSSPEVIASADYVILPGVGEASSAMQKLRDRGLVEVIKSLKCPVLGVCIGLQLMCESSEEGDAECLGIFPTKVKRFSAEYGLKVPHMGWNTIEDLRSPLFEGMSEGTYIYYVHSYAPELCDEAIATTTYGKKFSAAIQKDNFYGTQFHPEKSGEAGEMILKNFLKL